MVPVHCTSSQYSISVYEILELCSGQENLIKGNNSKSKQHRVIVLVHCTFSQCSLSFYEVSIKPFNTFSIIPRTRKFNKGK